MTCIEGENIKFLIFPLLSPKVMFTLRGYVSPLWVVLCTIQHTDMFPKQTGKLLYVFATAKVTERHVRSVNNQILEFIFSMMLVFNNYVRLKDFSEPSVQVPFYP